MPETDLSAASLDEVAAPPAPEETDSKPLESVAENAVIVGLLCKEIKARPEQVQATLALLEDENTVPFIARYRKEVTGNLDEPRIRMLEERRHYFTDLLARRGTVISTIESQGLLTPELRASIEGCLDRTRLEDLYLPYRPKRRTRAMIAVERGLEPLARQIYQQSQAETVESLNEKAEALVSEERGVANQEEAFAGARDVIAEWISEDAELRGMLRDFMFREGEVRSRLRTPKPNENGTPAGEGAPAGTPEAVSEEAEAAAAPAAAPGDAQKMDEKARSKAARAAQKQREREEALARYRIYHDFHESVRTIPSHRILAIRRASREEILTYSIEVDNDRALGLLRPQVVMDPESPYAPHVEAALQDAYHRLMKPSIENEVKQSLRKQADTEAIRVFTENLENLLMTPPAGSLVVMGIDPGFRTGCKIALVDTAGKVLDHATIYPNEPRNDEKGSEKVLVNLIERHGVGAIAIGNGTASRETHAFVRRLIAKRSGTGLFCVVVNESGASVYSASPEARDEFPDLDVSVRGAISIARRLQDPLAELVKIDPRSLGVGQYQHDIDQKRLRQALHDTVESCVNRVGVDLNSASPALLRYVAGLDEAMAEAIVKRRDNDGLFRIRQDMAGVAGISDRSFQQAAGFLRIRDGVQALDNTGVHPESYGVVDLLAKALGIEVAILLHTPDQLSGLDRQKFMEESGVGPFTLNDIVEELKRPGRDPRDKFVVPEFREDVQDLKDLTDGMELEGTVTNVANFGAFVDIGVHQDGLVHVSELSHRFVQDPREVVRVGDIVKVRVLSVDQERKRIALSMKSAVPPPADRPQGPRPPRPPFRPQGDRFERPQGDRFERPQGDRFERPQGDRFERGDRPDRRERFERPQRTEGGGDRVVATSEDTQGSSRYVPGSWKASGSPQQPAASTPGRAKAKPSVAAPKAPKGDKGPAAPQEVQDRIRALQERFRRD